MRKLYILTTLLVLSTGAQAQIFPSIVRQAPVVQYGPFVVSCPDGSCYNAGTTPIQGVDGGFPITIQGSISTTASGLIDLNNTTTIPLLADAGFTGTATDVSNYGAITVIVYADQNSAATATTGVALQFSPDGTNFYDASMYSFTAGGAAPNAGESYTVGVRGQYFRVVYTNGLVNQGAFSLQTILMQDTPTADILDLSTAPSNGQQHALLTQSTILGKNGTSFLQVSAHSSDTTTAGVGLEVQPGIAVTAPTAITAGQSEKLQQSTTNGGLFVNLVGGAGVLSVDITGYNTTAVGNGMTVFGAKAVSSPTAVDAGNAVGLEVDAANGRLYVELSSTQPAAPGVASTVADLMGLIFNSTEILPTNGQGFALQGDANGRLRTTSQVALGIAPGSGAIGVSGTTQILGLSGSGISYYVTGFFCSGSAGITCGLVSSTTAGNACATSPANVILAAYLPANGGYSPNIGYQAVKVAANSALCCTPSGGTASCQVFGYSAP